MKRKSHKKIFSKRSVILIVVSLFLGINIYNWNAENIVGNKLPMPFSIGCATVLSGSMQPNLNIDDLVFIKKTDEVAVNDIIVFQADNILVIHRIIEIDGDKIVTKGDANNMEDAPITKEDVKGVLIYRIPYVGKIVRLLKQPMAVIVIIILAFCLMEFSYKKEKDKDRNELDDIQQEIKKLMEELKEDSK